MFYTAAFRQNCSSDGEELQFSSLLGLDGFTLMFHTTTLICMAALLISEPCHFVARNMYLWCLLVRACRLHRRRGLLAGLSQALGILKFRTRPVPPQYPPTGLQQHGPHCTCKHTAYTFLILRERETSL